MTLSLLAIGRTGAGKSTIGNVILTGEPIGAFPTSDDPTSCTCYALTRIGTCGGDVAVSFTDTPGIPDVNPNETKQYYDIVINAIKHKSLSAIFFVFQYGRIDPDLYSKSKILFREIQKAKCLKVLIINDHANRFKPLTENQYLELVESISTFTEINYVFYKDCCFIDRGTMAEKLTTLVTRLQKVEPVPCSDLRSFHEMEDYVNKAKSEMERRQEAIKLIEAKILDINETRKILRREAILHCGAAVVEVGLVIFLPFTIIAGPIGVVLCALSIREAAKAGLELSRSGEEIPELENDKVITNQMIEDTIKKVKEEEENFKILCEALNSKRK